uniref:Uncharacterized protein n=1 Tax=Arcella intermedia TaxID=1963864 RepID=A0A6B2LAN5_9EUKA
MNKDNRALEDAEKCIQLKSDWPKGHFRRGVALAELLRHGEAILAVNHALSLVLATNAAPPAEMTNKLKEIVERVELNQDKNILPITDAHNLVSPQDYDAYVAKMKNGGETGDITPNDLEAIFLTCWTCSVARLQSHGNDSKRRPFVFFGTGYMGDGGTGLVPLVDNVNIELVANLLRKLTKDLKLRFIITVAIKANSYGLPYEKNPNATAWKNKKKEGVFIQLDSKHRAGMFFLPIGARKRGMFTFAQDQLEELDMETFKILPNILHN